MKKLILSMVLLVSATGLFAQSDYTIVTDSSTGNKYMLGEVKKADFDNELCSSWFYEEYENYHPNPEIIAKLKNSLPPSGIIFLATWCSDSRREVPRFFKIVDMAKWCPDNFTLYCLDREKKLEGVDVASYNIEYVPTFIMVSVSTGEEQGRIIETPNESLEGDLLKILGE
ncbi:MAG TPA: thioredoxin family protein [Bacteroidales bacterium]|nr:thioredoxin family protein [Bacteroidales bacterium]HQL70033.1 thioredoxin family protein [Bacteroidales bacterium]